MSTTTPPFAEGQKIICVDDNFHHNSSAFFDAFPVKGQSYIVRAIYEERGHLVVAGDGRLTSAPRYVEPRYRVLLEEIINSPDPFKKQHELGYFAARFRAAGG